MKIVYENGGIYLDTDVELIKPLDGLLKYDAYFGFEDGKYVATGLGFGAVKKNAIVKEVMDDYNNIPFVHEDGTFDSLPCPQRNTLVFLKHGLVQNDVCQEIDKCIFLASDWLCPYNYFSGEKKITSNTISIHHYDSSWMTTKAKKKHKKDLRVIKRNNCFHYIKRFPNRVIRLFIGDSKYDKIKKMAKKG